MPSFTIVTLVLLSLGLSSAGFAQSVDGAPGKKSKFDYAEAYATNQFPFAELRAAKIDPSDEFALVTAVRNEKQDPYVATAAAWVLRFHEASPATDGALLIAARSENEVLMGVAVESLVTHKNFDWADEASRRFPSLRGRDVRYWMAGNLALSGHYEGWALIRETIVRKGEDKHCLGVEKHCLDEAVREVRNFVGMKNEYGQPVDLNVELGEMFKVAPAESRTAIIKAMESIAPPPPAPKPRRKPQ